MNAITQSTLWQIGLASYRFFRIAETPAEWNRPSPRKRSNAFENSYCECLSCSSSQISSEFPCEESCNPELDKKHRTSAQARTKVRELRHSVGRKSCRVESTEEKFLAVVHLGKRDLMRGAGLRSNFRENRPIYRNEEET